MKKVFNHRTNSKNLILAAAAFFAAAMVVFPSVTESGSKSAIIIWANAIVPVLLPFFIFADFIKRTGNLQRLPVQLYPLLIAVLSGYPMGAKIVGDLVGDGTLSRARGREVLSYSLVTGPAFLMGTIGAFLGSTRAALIIMLAHYLGALLNGCFFHGSKRDMKLRARGGTRRRGVEEMPFAAGSFADSAAQFHAGVAVSAANPSSHAAVSSVLDNFTISITSGFKAMAVILAYLMIFMIGIDLAEAAGIWTHLGSELTVSFLKGILEMTVGANMISLCNASLAFKTVLIATIVSFGGLSVIGQSVSMAAGSGIRLADILQIKLMHGIFSGILAMLLTRVML